MSAYVEPYFDSIRQTSLSMKLASKPSTGEMHLAEQAPSWDGEAQQWLWWWSLARQARQTTPTGWHMAPHFFEFPENIFALTLIIRTHKIHQDPMSRAKQALDAVRGRSATLYIDLDKSNKRKRTEVLSEEEADDDIPMLPGPSNVEAAPEPQDHWDVHEDGITWTRIHVQPREELYVPRDDQTVPWQNFRPDRLTTIRRPPPFTQRTVLQDDWQLSDASRRMPFSWTGSTTFTMRVTGQQGSPTTPVTSTTGNMPSNETTEPSPTAAPAAPIDRQTSQQEPEPPPPDSGMDSTEQSMQTIPEHQRQLYQAPPEGETFAQQRARFDRQETLSMYETAKGPVRYGPHREPFATDRQQERTPYSRPPIDEPDIQDNITTVVDVDVTKSSTHTLPPGWRIEDGYITLDMDNIQDEWVLHNNTLIRRHYNPRKTLFHPDSDECTLPIPIECLAKDRTSKMAGHVHHDRWRNKKSSSKTNNEWTGHTSFKILPCFRHLAKQAFYKTSNGHSSFQGNDGETCHYQGQATAKAAPKAKARKEQLSERQMSLQDRLAFLEAKKSELDSFFKNDVWEADSMENVPEGRLLKAHFILKWSKWADGSPRAKARLITQGFKDPDALNGMIDTEAPTLSRLSRNFILSVLCNLQWINFSADISTAFLQGKKHADNRTLWIALPADARRILGFGSEDKVMKLKKPMYGLCDAPRAWYLEARDRLCRLGAVQHPLDPCLFLIYDWEAPDEQWTVQKELTNNEEFNRHPPLCGLLGLHVDDLLGGGDSSNKSYQKFITALKENFQFRSWEEEKSVEYCGAKIERISSSHYEISHKTYLEKQKPISCESLSKHKPDTNEISAKERTLLRGLIGALQWPATQSSPHLQAMVSGMAGSVNSATVGTLKEANKALRFAKQHSDVTLQYKRLGDPSELTFMTYCDAAFASRADLSSQGGYLVMMVNKDVTTGQEGSYQLIDWRSWKLPRVARSSLAAESQAASEAADAMLYASTFWKLMWAPNLPLDDPMTPKLKNNPCLVTDAKALYDLLIRQDLQSSGGADKRTTIEVLVTKDKLRCAAATVKWLSSELQFADGMTKSSAAMLLAQRLRTHMTRIKPDPNFVAAKKKTPEQRKASQEQYAVKKPEKALLAVLSTTLMHPVMADETEGAFSSDNMLFLVFFTLMMMFAVHGFLCGVQRTWRSLPPWSTMMTRSPWTSEQSCAEYHLETTATETAVQTDPRPSEDTLVGLRRQVKDLTRRLEQTEEYSEALERQNGRMRQECDQQLETLRKRYDDRLREEITVRLQQILNKPVYHTNHGECWHASEVCARGATLNPIHVKRPCKKCYYNYPEVYLGQSASSTSSTGVSLTLSNEWCRHVLLGLMNLSGLPCLLEPPNVPQGWASWMVTPNGIARSPVKKPAATVRALQWCYLVRTLLGLVALFPLQSSECDIECAMSGVWCRVCDVGCVMSSVWCRVCDVECVMSGVWCRVCDVECVMSGVWCQVCDVECVMLGVWYRMCDVECVMSGVWCRVCDVGCVMLVCDLKCVILSVRCRVCDVGCVMSSVWCRVCDVECVMSGVWCRVCDVECVMSGVWCQVCDVECVMLGVWYRMCDVGCVISDVWCCLGESAGGRRRDATIKIKTPR